MNHEDTEKVWCEVVGCENYETNPDAYVAHLILKHDKHHKNANEITRSMFEDYNLKLNDPDFEKSTQDKPICADCGYHVEETNSDSGSYYCNNCRAVLQEKHVGEL